MAVSMISLIAKVIANYKGYKTEKKKEEDILVRMAIIRELNKTKNRIRKFSIENEKAKKIMDEIDVFVKDIEYSTVGHKYAFFSSKYSPNKDKIKKLIEHDFLISKKLEEIENILSDEHGIDLANVHHIIKALKNIYIDRESLLRK